MQITIDENRCVVQREKDDKAFYGRPSDTNWGSGESTLLHHVKLKLNADGYDLIKKRMWKDGHFVDDTIQYLRVRNPAKLQDGDIYCIHDNQWSIRNSAEDYNTYEPVVFTIERA